MDSGDPPSCLPCTDGPSQQPTPPLSITNQSIIHNKAGIDDAGDNDGIGGVEMTPAVLKAAALAHDGYETPALNDRLYLHYRVRYFVVGGSLVHIFKVGVSGE